jgi:MFS family permease
VADHGGFAAFRFKDFSAFFIARAFNAMAVQMVDVAIGWLVYALTGSAFALGLVGLCIFLPNFLLALPAGQVADMFPRKKILAFSSFVSTSVAIALFIAAATESVSVPFLFVLITVSGIARAFLGAASGAIIPSLVPQEHLPNAIALSSSAYQTATIAGPAIGGLLYALGPEVVFGVTALCFGISFSSYLLITPRVV